MSISLKRVLASAALASAAAITAAPAMADGPTTLTADETRVLALLQKFNDCQQDKLGQLQASAQGIAAARAKASEDATRAAAKSAGLSDDDANFLVSNLGQIEAQMTGRILATKAQIPQTCAKELNIDMKKDGAVLAQVKEKASADLEAAQNAALSGLEKKYGKTLIQQMLSAPQAGGPQ